MGLQSVKTIYINSDDQVGLGFAVEEKLLSSGDVRIIINDIIPGGPAYKVYLMLPQQLYTPLYWIICAYLCTYELSACMLCVYACIVCVHVVCVYACIVCVCMYCVRACIVCMHVVCVCMYCVRTCSVCMHVVCACMYCVRACSVCVYVHVVYACTYLQCNRRSIHPG